MRIEKLFNVLVLGGASLGLACGETGSGSTGGGGEDGSGGAPTNPQGTGGGSETSAGLGGSGGAGDVGSTSTTTVSTGSMLMCSPIPDPGDPCGCPCCWVDNCSNEDADCCAGFCEGTCC